MPKLSLAKLERHLFSAADRLRQEGLDAATYKDYIFGMLQTGQVWPRERVSLLSRKLGVAAAELMSASSVTVYCT
jgi:type I restriction enzyme M protein